jgi:3-oxoacyl-[acyl-carrier protein] reductase/2-hydroxycyclohexanecarboxyl-CoA dehydrogenase
MVSEAVNRFGDLHILVNNAGINRDAIMHKMTDEQWDQVIAVNLSGVFYCSRAAIQYMRTREYGRIINISSAGWQGNIGQANYAAAKAGVIGLTKTIAKENARKRITCNAICPGFIDTKMTRGVPSDVWKMMVGKIPMGYVGEPEDIGKAVAFLASDDAAYITAEVLNVGGGFVL